MRRVRYSYLFAALSLVLAVLAAPSAHSAEGSGAVDDFIVKTRSGAKGVWGAISEPSPSEALAKMVITHARNQERLRGMGAALGPAGAQSRDIDVDGDGTLDIAVLVDDGTMILPAREANPLDLAPGMRIRYTPTGANTYEVALATGESLDPVIGAALPLGDDDFEEVSLTASFPFLGTSYSSIFVGSDGHITFGVGDGSSTLRDAARHVGGPPRLSALLTDLNPECGGSVHADVRPDRAVVTWDQVVHFQRGDQDGCDPGVPSNTFQAVLHADGSLDYVYGELDAGLIGTDGGNREAVTGIAEGGSEGPINEIDMTADLPVQLEAGAIFEQYSPASPETFDLIRVSQAFYEGHEDKYDYLTMFTDFEIFGGGTAFSAGIKNETLGLGLNTFDFSGLLGSDGELETFLWMNNINLWAGNSVEQYIDPPLHRFTIVNSERLAPFLINPNTQAAELFGFVDITGTGNSTGYTHHGRAVIRENPHTEARATRGTLRYSLNSAISIMFQEADHRWSAFSAFVHPTKGIVIPDSFDLLGRDLAHWSTFFNTRVVDSGFTQADGMPRFSGMEGNAIIELTAGDQGEIVDLDDPSRVVADPTGELADGLASCDAQGKSFFLTEPDELVDGATELDQYLMGVRTAEQVGPFWYVDDPSSPLDGRSLDEPFPTDFIRGSTFNLDDIGFCGVRVDLTVDNITDLGTILGIPARGPRVPAIGDENDVGPLAACLAENLGSSPCVDVKSMAWILVVKGGPPNSAAHMPAIRRLNELQKAWQAYVDGPGLGGRNADGVVRAPTQPGFVSKFDTSLEPAIH